MGSAGCRLHPPGSLAVESFESTLLGRLRALGVRGTYVYLLEGEATVEYGTAFVEFYAEDAGRAEPEFLYRMIEAVVGAGASEGS